MKSGKNRVVPRLGLLALAGIALVLSVMQVGAEYNRLLVQRYTATPPGEDADRLRKMEGAAKRAVSFYPFPGGMDDIYSAWLEYRRQYRETGENEQEELLRHKDSSLIAKRNDALGWASLAENLEYYGRKGFDFHYALQSAVRFGKYDYDAARLVLGVSIREWPRLDCYEKRAVVKVIEYAERVEDNVIFYRNYDSGIRQLRDYLEEVSEQYGFDPKWAKFEAGRCQPPRS